MTNSKAKSDDKLFLLIDGHAIVFRAWFAMRDHLITASGQNTTGASGFMSMFLKVIREQNPTHIAVTFDTKASTFRKEMFPAYKAQRKEVDPAFTSKSLFSKRFSNQWAYRCTNTTDLKQTI